MSGTVIQELPRALEISEQQLLSWISSSGKKGRWVPLHVLTFQIR